jgi:hypothetical protein
MLEASGPNRRGLRPGARCSFADFMSLAECHSGSANEPTSFVHVNGSIPQVIAAVLAAVVGGTLATDFATTIGVILTAVGLMGVVFTIAAGRQSPG